MGLTEEPNEIAVDRRSMIKRTGWLFGAGGALAALALPRQAAGQGVEHDIAGLWQGVVSSPANLFPPFKTFELYGAGLWIASGQTDLTHAAMDSSLWGTFKKVGPGTFRAVGRFWTYDPQANPTGFGAVDEIITVSQDGRAYRGEGPVQYFDTNCNSLGPAVMTVDNGQRISIPD